VGGCLIVVPHAPLYRRAPEGSPWFERGTFWLHPASSSSAQLDWLAHVQAGEPVSTQGYCRYEYRPPPPELGVAVNLDDELIRVAVKHAASDERLRRLRDLALERAAELAKPPEDWVQFGDSSSAGLIYMGAKRLQALRVSG